MSPFAFAVGAIVALSLLGLPVGHAMIAGSVLYLYLKGLDVGTAAEQLLNGMYTSYLLLAIPLFILAAEFMNSGPIMDRLLRFCNALVGRWRGGLMLRSAAAGVELDYTAFGADVVRHGSRPPKLPPVKRPA